MTQENKELLLRDLCARLPYGVKVAFFNEDLTYHSEHKTLTGIECINNLNYSSLEDEDGNTAIVEFCRPYLFPLSSMTEDQHVELLANGVSDDPYTYIDSKAFNYLIDFYNKNHFDYRGLIPKGLAIDATGLNIY